jgi:zinc/manganese transport system permease protein
MNIVLTLLADLQQMWGFSFMRNAFEVGAMNAIVAGVTGYFVVLRRSAFTAHAFSEIGFAGAAAAVLLGGQPILGLLGGSTMGALAIAALGRRATNRDTQIGIVLAFALGLGILFISLYSGYANESYSILFGEIEGVSPFEVELTVVASALVLFTVGVLYRPLLFASLDEDVAEAQGMPMMLLGTAFMVIVAVAVSFAVQVTGVLLIFSLMVTPAATAQYLSRRPQGAIILSATIALMATWVGLLLGWAASYYPPTAKVPISFFITAIVFCLYLAVRGIRLLAPRRLHRLPATA